MTHWRAIAAHGLAAGLLCWPALYNGYPLLYPDSIDYIAALYGYRSPVYKLVILPLHLRLTPWAVIVFHAVLVVYLVRLSLDLVLPGAGRRTLLAVVAFLAAGSSLPWFVSFVMPDILAGTLVLSLFLLAWNEQPPDRLRTLLVGAIACFSIASHGSHLLLGCGLAIVVAIARLALWRVAVVCLLAIGSLLGMHQYLYGKPSLNGDAPPFLLARTIADGPGRLYLRGEGCERDWTICRYRDRLDLSSGRLLWGEEGIFLGLDPQARRPIQEEELPVVLASIRAYPMMQLAASARNVAAQIRDVRIAFYPASYVAQEVSKVLRLDGRSYFDSRQSRGTVPSGAMGRVAAIVLGLSIAVCVFCGLRSGRSYPRPLLALTAFFAVALVGNALITATLATVSERYQSRMIWILPLLASCYLLAWSRSRGKDRA